MNMEDFLKIFLNIGMVLLYTRFTCVWWEHVCACVWLAMHMCAYAHRGLRSWHQTPSLISFPLIHWGNRHPETGYTASLASELAPGIPGIAGTIQCPFGSWRFKIQSLHMCGKYFNPWNIFQVPKQEISRINLCCDSMHAYICHNSVIVIWFHLTSKKTRKRRWFVCTRKADT